MPDCTRRQAIAHFLAAAFIIAAPPVLARDAGRGNSGGNGNGGGSGNGGGNSGNSGGSSGNGNAGGNGDANSASPDTARDPAGNAHALDHDSVPAATGSDQEVAREAVRSGNAKPLGTIAPAIEQEYDAQMVDVTIGNRDGRMIYRMKMLSEGGRVFVIDVDAASGRPL